MQKPSSLSLLAICLPAILLSLSLLLFFFYFGALEKENNFPVLYKGRYRPAEAYARLWLYDFYHAKKLKKEHLGAFHTISPSALEFLWSLEFLGHEPFEQSPLFWLGSAKLKNLLSFPSKEDRFSDLQIQLKLGQISDQQDELAQLRLLTSEFNRLEKGPSSLENEFVKRFEELKLKKTPPIDLARLLEQEFPLNKRLKNSGGLFFSLPSRMTSGEWVPLKAVKTRIYHPPSNSLKPVGNFTLFSDADFENVRGAYAALEQAFNEGLQSEIVAAEKHLSHVLKSAYEPLAGTTVRKAHEKSLTYPSQLQLTAESIYVSYPWIPLLLVLYGIAVISLWAAHRLNSQWTLAAFALVALAAFSHTLLIAVRSYILERPPVSNMFETVIYVPWVAVCACFAFPAFRRQKIVWLAACFASMILLMILEITDLNQTLDQVQAVLDSQFWLSIHVLLVVGSYGMFILAAVLGHFYLVRRLSKINHFDSIKITGLKRLSDMILQAMYGGTALLISGTILGGIWAAQSWGRFWDWDPKESWAFISSCFYLICIHAHRFGRISSFGLAIGAVMGLLAISFTWYGVNYILGTGLHSYGFGSGGEISYYAFLAFECLFIIVACKRYQNEKFIEKRD